MLVAAPRQHGEARRHVAVEPRHVQVPLERLRLPEQREVVEDHIVSGERHVVRQARARQRHVDVVHQVVVLVDHAVVHVGRRLGVVEEQQFVGALVDLRVRRHAAVEREATVPGFLAQRLRGEWVDAVEVAALVEAAQRGPAVDDDVGAGGVLEQGAGSPAVVDLGQRQRFGQPRPQRSARSVLGDEAVGLYEPVAVERFAVPEADDMQHAVAVERVVCLERGVQRVLGVAQVYPVEVSGDLTLDGDEVVGAPLGALRPPRPGAVGMIVVLGKRGQVLADNLDVHCQATSADTDHEADRRGGAAAEVQRAEPSGAVDLVVAGQPADLFGGVEQHPDARRTDRMAAADQSAAGVDRQPAADLDLAVLDGLPRLPGTGQADVVDGQVLTRGEAVVHLETTDVVEGDLGATQRVLHGGAYVRNHIGVAGVAVEFLAQAQADRAMSPPLDQSDRPDAGVIAQEVVADEDDCPHRRRSSGCSRTGGYGLRRVGWPCRRRRGWPDRAPASRGSGRWGCVGRWRSSAPRWHAGAPRRCRTGGRTRRRPRRTSTAT